MVKIKKRKLGGAEIPTSSMADIAFLLLLFFLVSTVIDVDTGIGLTLPEYVPIEEQQFVPLSKDRLAALLINENGDVLLNSEIIAIPQIANRLTERIESKIGLPSNKKLVVSVKTDRKTNYNLYIQSLDQVKSAYFSVRENYARVKFGKDIDKLTEEELSTVRDEIPIIISIAEPEQVNN
ncbi:MAG: biopolymer transporter ExbD [Melioribacteraceae bacterium]|nr:biopolymer transporter ExbD [Melioribacteraceae bacterium]MCF8352947.1 biopolymer transporter ExbD [Melioribacteraceae bacterium]MCF8395883.1 biopolymer transporter ExbD [Melioribacteraceae bacterium]MCF8417464.1 biopolymer transporter ExbD [Melioribacteraceae bacterium]